MDTSLVRLGLVLSLTGLLVACAPAAAPSPTAAPAKPAATSAPAAKPAATTAPAPAAKPTAAPAAKALAADYFAGKTITVSVNFSAGGPTDVFARLLAQYLDKHVQGKPTIVVENRTGAGGSVGLNYLYQAAKKDGTVLGVISSPFSEQALFPDRVQYDVAKYAWVGGVDEASVAFTDKSLGIKTYKELLAPPKETVVGGLSPESNKDLEALTFLNTIGAKYKYVTGFPGATEARAALLRGEINYYSESLTGWVTAIVPLVQQGAAFPMAQRGIIKGGKLIRDPRVKDIPLYDEVAVDLKGEDVRKTISYRAIQAVAQVSSLLRAIIYPPGTDPAVVEAMRKAVADTFADKEFQATGEKMLGFSFEFIPGSEAQELAKSIVEAKDKEALDHLRKLANEKG